MNDSVQRRFDSKVDRSGEHHIWLGAARGDGPGMFKLDGRPLLARRVAWELDHVALPEGARVERCATSSAACVRVDHLTLAGMVPAVEPVAMLKEQPATPSPTPTTDSTPPGPSPAAA